jgi:hypothetical protein
MPSGRRPLPLPFPALIAAILIAVLVPSQEAHACSARIARAPALAAEYDPFDPADLIMPGRVSVENTGAAPCTLLVGFEAPLGGADTVQIEIRSDAGSLLTGAGGDAAAGDLSTRRELAQGESLELSYQLRMPAGQMQQPGHYDRSFGLSLRKADGGTGGREAAVIDRASLTASWTVRDRIGLNIAGAGTAKTIDFGVLTEGESQRVIVETRGNRGFLLDVSSRNHGALTMAAPYEQWRIPYTLSVDGEGVSLPARLGPFGETGIAGEAIELTFVIGDASAKRAGLYTDEVTIEIRPAL